MLSLLHCHYCLETFVDHQNFQTTSIHISATTLCKIILCTNNQLFHSFQTHPSVEVKKVKELFTQHFPEATTSATNDDGTKWLESVLENLKQQIVSNKSSLSNTTNSPIANNNHLNNSSDVDKSKLNGDTSNSSTSSPENEVVLLQNAQMKATVEEYKNIIAETVSWKRLCVYIVF